MQCATVNVLNEGDEALLGFLEGDAFQGGLQLLTTAQPALAPFAALTVGLTETIAKRNRNVAVQAVDLGLDFSQIAVRPKLAEGSYIAVQIPETMHSTCGTGRTGGMTRPPGTWSAPCEPGPADPLQLLRRQRQPLPRALTGPQPAGSPGVVPGRRRQRVRRLGAGSAADPLLRG